MTETATNLEAVASSKSQITLAWTDNLTSETSFWIERCKGATCTEFAQNAMVGADVTSFSNAELAPNTTYSYRVRAYNGTGGSGYSNVAKATTPKR